MLKSLYIKNFRALKDFQVARLGHVNLIVGKNNSGKSSVLEALRIYAGNANQALLESIAAEHDEKTRASEFDFLDNDGQMPFEAFFAGRRYPSQDDAGIVIGESESNTNALKIEHGFLLQSEENVTAPDGESITQIIRRRISREEAKNNDPSSISQALFISKGDRSYRLRFDSSSSRIRSTAFELASPITCGFIPTRFVTTNELAEEWDKVVLTDYEGIIKNALKIINDDLEGIAFVNDDEQPSRRSPRARVAKVKLASSDRPVPLNSMGDGMLRILQLVLKVFSARGGILLIDEFENGLHYSVQELVWKLLFELSRDLDIQIFATTHSWDCIKSFASASRADKAIDGVLFRVGASVRSSDRGRIISTVFQEEELENITQADIEIR